MANAQALRRTALYRSQAPLGARFVDFHGWELPVQFESILKEHQAVRQRCGLFDVSHMGQVRVTGKDALKFTDWVNTNDVKKCKPGKGVYSHLTRPNGGIVDDVIAFCLAPEEYFIVVNASTADKDVAWFKEQAGKFDVEIVNESDRWSMLALQGPSAMRVADGIVAGASALPRFGILPTELYGQPAYVSRTGYTGEDGVEFQVANEVAVRLWEDIMTKGRSEGLAPCGLGARDTLRLEAGLLLYGNDIDDEHTPLEAGYDWVVKFDKGDFVGKAALLKQKAEGVKRKWTGFKLTGPGVPRPGMTILVGGKPAGTLCSATFSPSLKTGIGVGYVAPLAVGTKAAIELHGRSAEAEVTALPFWRKSV